MLVAGPYRWEAHDLRGYGVQTNRFTFGAYRGPGAPTAAFAIETLLDELAEALGIDPVELRLRNAVVEDDVGVSGNRFPRMGVVEVLERVREHPLWKRRDSLPAGEGIGVAAGYWAGGMEPASAVCRVNQDGTMTVITSAADMSGVNTGFATIAAEAFGLSYDQIRVVSVDTATGPYAGASGGSKVTYTVGKAVLRAAEAAREKLLAAASEELEIAPADLEVVDGVVRAVGAPDRSISVAEISAKALRFGGRYEPIEGHGGSAQTRGAPSVAAHLAHVRVDRETGEIELLGHAIAQDVGRALNPALVEGQMRGGTAQGIGWALFEELVHDESGQLLTGSFMDYAIPVAERVPDIDTLIVEVPAPDGPFGAKGIGEAPVIAAAPAIANAVAAAVGIRMRELPMTAPRIWAALPARRGLDGMTSVERARAIVDTYEVEVRTELPEGAYLFDAHTHLGDDIDGMHGRYEELTALLERYGFAGAFVFCLDEPDREPGFCVPNDRTLAHAGRSGGRLFPFVRLDLTASPLEEARRALDLGARGIKLHPRAQAFALDDERLGPIFELARERAVPILIHGGRGLPRSRRTSRRSSDATKAYS